MADINLHKIFEKLNDKMEKDGSNWAAPSAVVVDSYKSGASWYRIWSDGWVEQGGYIAASTSTSQVNTLLIPMADTNYTINITAVLSTWSGGLNSVHALTTTSFKLWTSDDSSFNSCPIKWEVRGYKA